jgi:hypothetical protein
MFLISGFDVPLLKGSLSEVSRIPTTSKTRLHSSAVQRQTICGELLERIETVVIRDMSPETEATLWWIITAAWLAYDDKLLNDEATTDEGRRGEPLARLTEILFSCRYNNSLKGSRIDNISHGGHILFC